MKAVVTTLLACLSLAAPVSAAEVCLVPSSNGNHVTVDCDPVNPQAFANATIGYSTDGPPCTIDECILFEPGRSDRQYGWSISSSPSDAFQNSGPLPEGLVYFYLWLYCPPWDGMTAVEMRLSSDQGVPGISLFGFTPMNGVLQAGTFPDLLLAVGGCPPAPFLAGQIAALHVSPVSVDAESWAGIKSMYR